MELRGSVADSFGWEKRMLAASDLQAGLALSALSEAVNHAESRRPGA